MTRQGHVATDALSTGDSGKDDDDASGPCSPGALSTSDSRDNDDNMSGPCSPWCTLPRCTLCGRLTTCHGCATREHSPSATLTCRPALKTTTSGLPFVRRPRRFLHAGLTIGDDVVGLPLVCSPGAPFTINDNVSAGCHLHLRRHRAPQRGASSTPSPMRSLARVTIHVHRHHRRARARRASSTLLRTRPIIWLRSHRLSARQGCWLHRHAY